MMILKNIWKILSSNRFKSFYWRTSMMFMAGVLSLLAENLGDLQIKADLTVILGLILGEISKAINNYYSRK